VPRLRRSDCSSPGWRRVRRGRGFAYLHADGTRIEDPQTLERLRDLVIPPAWRDVWICPDPHGHLQATGVDAAGRKQYVYHPRWRERRDREKFAKMERFARALPALRAQIAGDLQAGDAPTRTRVLACAARLLDIGLFRIGGEEYAEEEHGVGLATIRREHVRIEGARAIFDYPAKSGVRRVHAIADPACVELIRTLRRRRSGDGLLLGFRDAAGRWRPLRSDDINDYLKAYMGEDFSAKDFRTWNATVLAAVALALAPPASGTKVAARRAINTAVKGVAVMLGNTPAVARRSYIDPRVFDRYLSGWTIGGALEDAGDLERVDEATRRELEEGVLDLLAEDTSSPALERVAA
jgi:DNA topoisomerase IB